MKNNKQYTVGKKCSILFLSSRPVSWINTAFPFVAGYLFVNDGALPTWFFIAALYFLIPYNMLIYVINDIFDYESDMRNPRKGGVEGAVLDKQLHPFMATATVAINIPLVWYLLVAIPSSARWVLLVCVLDAVVYSVPPLRLKERPVADSVSSSLHFVGPLIFALVAVGWQVRFWPYVIAFFLWGMASHAFGAVQDIVPDRKAGLSSIATRFGASVTVRLSLLWYALAVLLLALRGWPEIVVAMAGLCYVKIVAPYVAISDKQSARSNIGWKYFMKINQLLGFIITIILILHLS